MEKKPNENDFSLQKVKILPGGGLCADYKITEVVNEDTRTAEYQVTFAETVHPDLNVAFDALRKIVADVFGYNDDQKEKIEVRGISWSGLGENIGVVITGTYECLNGQKVAINTPRIKIEGESFGNEEELARLLDAATAEVYQYLFNGKQSQLSLFGGEPEGSEAEE